MRRRGIRTAAIAALLALAVGASSPAQAAGVSRVGPGPGPAGVAVLDVVMLVDESGSETPAKVADEQQTAGTIVQSMLNPRSRVTVIGFGGVNNIAPDQNPVDVVCQPTIASGAANLSYLASCVSKLHRRTEIEGDDTDYAAALGQAMNYFNPGTQYGQQSPPGAIKVILMMTDGAVDMHRDTQQYGVNWQLGEQQAVDQQLAAAKHNGVQVWPLGFGTDIGTGMTQSQALSYLNQIAVGAAPAVCDTRHGVNQPHASWVNNPTDAIAALSRLYADAACLGTNFTNSASTLVGGTDFQTRPLTVTVTIPAIASDAVISVDRGNPGVQVGFLLPDGKVWTDASAISGQGLSPVEVLHVNDITGSEVGTWQIRLTAPSGLASQLVSATLFWQGAVRAVVTANPPSARPGQPIAVTLNVLGPNGPVTDSATLESLFAGVTVSGDGLPGPILVPVTRAAAADHVGEYTGSFTAPEQAGMLTFTGTTAGYGLYAMPVPATVMVGQASAGFTASVQFPVLAAVVQDASITGHVIFTNQAGATRHVRLVLSTSGVDASITSPPGPITAPPGNPPAVPFTVSVGQDSPVGSAWLEVEVVDAANTRLAYSATTLVVMVIKPPGSFDRYTWGVVILAPLILIVFAILWWWVVVRSRRDAAGRGRSPAVRTPRPEPTPSVPEPTMPSAPGPASPETTRTIPSAPAPPDPSTPIDEWL